MQIDNNIPPPDSRAHPFKRMEVGESVFYAGENTQSRCVLYAHSYGAKTGKKFTARTLPEGVRIWRVE